MDKVLEEIQAALCGADCQVRFGISFRMVGNQMTTIQTAQVFRQEDGRRWKPVGPLLVPPEGQETSRSALLRLLAGLIEDSVHVEGTGEVHQGQERRQGMSVKPS